MFHVYVIWQTKRNFCKFSIFQWPVLDVIKHCLLLPKTGRHYVSDIRQAEQHERNAENGVENSHHFSIFRFWRNVTVSCNRERKNGEKFLVFVEK